MILNNVKSGSGAFVTDCNNRACSTDPPVIPSSTKTAGVSLLYLFLGVLR